MTNDELEAENIRLTIENRAMRELLGSIRWLADVPRPADVAELQVHYMECVRRIDVIAVYAEIIDLADDTRDVFADVLHDRAQALREHADRPLRYTPRAFSPEVTR